MSETVGRRLPVYILLDTSGSMLGQPIESVRMGLNALVADLRSDGMALETAHLSLITFDNDARQLCPLTDLAAFQVPDLQAHGMTYIGAALNLLEMRLQAEVRQASGTQKGDWKPLVVLMTDGQPTDGDAYNQASTRLRDLLRRQKIGNIIGCAAGPEAKVEELKKVSDHVVRIDALSPHQFKQFFKWVSDSIKVASTPAGQTAVDDTGGTPLVTPPDDIIIV